MASLLAPMPAAGATVVDRDEFSTTVDVGGGKLKTSLSSEPLNYQTDSGAWKPIDTDLETQPDGDLHPAAVDGDVAIPDSLAQPIELEHDGYAASFRLLGAEGDADADGAEASFAHAIPGVDVSYVARAHGVKETLELQNALSPRSFVYDLRGGAAWSASVESGDVVLRDGSGTERYRVSAPLAWDSAPDPAFTNTLNLSVSKVSDGRWRVTLRPDADWLSDPTRQFPVSIDPDFSWSDGTTHFHGAQDCYLAGVGQANNTFCAQSYLQTGWFNRPYKSIFRFDIAAAIPSNASVTSAVFKAYAPPASPHVAVGHSLHTITSDWDSTATWNSRKTGVPWTTAGGDIAAATNLTSSSTTVQAYSRWYSWSAPVAAVQGWVAGTLPNYGFLLSSDAAGNTGNAYAWASTEASTSSTFPADSTQWPTLDVTWSQPSAVDVTSPTAATSVQMEPVDPMTATAWIGFGSGDDPAGAPGEPVSGLAGTDFRVKIRNGTFSAWSTVALDSVVVPGVNPGDAVTVQLKTRDKAGNVSSVTNADLTATAPPVDESGAPAVADLMDTYGMSQLAAFVWLGVQDRTAQLDDTIRASQWASSYAGAWFDNATSIVHISVTSSAAQAGIVSMLDVLGLTPYVAFSVVSSSQTALDNASNSAQTNLADLIELGSVRVYPDAEFNAVVYELSSQASSTVQSRVASSRSQLAVATRLVTSTDSDLNGDPTSCGAMPVSWDNAWNAHGVWYCTGPLRGGTSINTHPDGLVPDPNAPGDCTLGYNAFTDATPHRAVIVTAGHCMMPELSPGCQGASNLTRKAYSSRPFGKSPKLQLSEIGAVKQSIYKGCDNKTILKVDAGAAYSDNSALGPPQRWIFQHEYTGSLFGTGLLGTDLKEDPMHSIGRTATPIKRHEVCFSGAVSDNSDPSAAKAGPTTQCAQVSATGLRFGNAAYVRGHACAIGGDSGSPVFAGHTAYGIVTRGPKFQTRSSPACGFEFQGARTLQTALSVTVITEKTATQNALDTQIPVPTTAPALTGSCSMDHRGVCGVTAGVWTGSPTIQYSSHACGQLSDCGTLSSSPTIGVDAHGSGACHSNFYAATVVATNQYGRRLYPLQAQSPIVCDQ